MTDNNFTRQWQLMLSGQPYEASNPEFLNRLVATRDILWEYNSTRPSDTATLERIIRSLLGHIGNNFVINQPFRCDYGCNIHIGDNLLANFNLTILDEAPVTIGDNVFIGPNVSIFTACHPLDAHRRNTGEQWALPVTIGSGVWIGGNCTILPGVTIGDGAVIGAGSVVTRSIAPDTLAVGNPARPIRRLNQ